MEIAISMRIEGSEVIFTVEGGGEDAPALLAMYLSDCMDDLQAKIAAQKAATAQEGIKYDA